VERKKVVAVGDKALKKEGLIPCLLHRFDSGIEAKVPADHFSAEYIDAGRRKRLPLPFRYEPFCWEEVVITATPCRIIAAA
jgi:hypothetical protein